MHTTLISTDVLAEHLADTSWLIADCRYNLNDETWGRAQYEAAHIPEAVFVDVAHDLAGERTGTNGRHPLPSIEDMAATFARLGIADDLQVIAYDQEAGAFASRLWWMLRYLGHDSVAVLDGGLDAWKSEGRPLERGAARGYPAATFHARPRPGFFVDKHAVLAATKDPGTVVVNALGPQSFRGEENRYGRPGRVPASVNVPWTTLVDAKTKTFKPLAEARTAFEAEGISGDKPVIAYCGGGISATVDLFVLHQLGHDRLTLYDGSMGEWATDPTLPIETG